MIKIFRKIHDFLVDRERLDLELNWITKLWYIFLLIGTTIYVVSNFTDIVAISFYKKLDGRGLIFIMWLLLLVLPLFESFEGFGVHIKRNRTEQKQLSDDIMNMTNKLIEDKIKPVDSKDIEEMFKELGHE